MPECRNLSINSWFSPCRRMRIFGTRGTINMPIGDARHFLERADHCFRLARCISDRDTTAKLQALGRKLMNEAAGLNAEREGENGLFSVEKS
jgi:hypothetical protein